MLVSTPGLTGAGGQGAGGQSVARLATVGAETRVRAATALLHGKRTLKTPGTIHLHGLGATRGELGPRKGSWEGEGTRGGARGRMGRGLGAGAGSICLILLDGDGSCHIGREGGGEGATREELETNGLLQLPGKKVNEGVVRPPRVERVSYVLEGNGQI